MEKRVIDGIEIEVGSGNVFADLGLPDAEKLKIKSGLVFEITKAIRRLGLTQEQAARRMGIAQRHRSLKRNWLWWKRQSEISTMPPIG